MPDSAKVVINLATGLDDGERVTVALLVGGAALEQGKQVTMFLTKEAVRLALAGHAEGIACDGCPPIPPPVRAVRRRRRTASRLPRLLQRPQAERERAGRERSNRRRNPPLAVDRR